MPVDYSVLNITELYIARDKAWEDFEHGIITKEELDEKLDKILMYIDERA